MKCVFCRAETKRKKVRVVQLGKDLGEYTVEVCQGCGEQYYSSRVVDRLQQKQQELGIWGLGSQTHVAQYGNSLTIRIKKKLAEFVGLKKGTRVDIVPKGPKLLELHVR